MPFPTCDQKQVLPPFHCQWEEVECKDLLLYSICDSPDPSNLPTWASLSR